MRIGQFVKNNSMDRYKKSCKSVLLALMICSMSACSKMVSSPLPTSINTEISLVATSTQTVVALASSTQPSTETPTTYVSPTLSPSFVTNYLLNLYSKKECELPCWWGITPGKTAWEDVYREFSSVGSIYGPGKWRGREYYGVEFQTEIGRMPVDYVRYTVWVQDGIVMGILSNMALITQQADISLADILSHYGEPEEIWLNSIRWGGLLPDTYINLYYPSKGIWLVWKNHLEVNDNRFTICPMNRTTEYRNPAMVLFSIKSQMSFEDAWNIMTANMVDEKLGKSGPYGPLEKFTDDFNTEKFYQTYLDPSPTQCFDIDPMQ